MSNIQIARKHVGKSEYYMAWINYMQLLFKNPTDWKAYAELGEVLLLLDDVDGSLECYYQALMYCINCDKSHAVAKRGLSIALSKYDLSYYRKFASFLLSNFDYSGNTVKSFYEEVHGLMNHHVYKQETLAEDLINFTQWFINNCDYLDNYHLSQCYSWLGFLYLPIDIEKSKEFNLKSLDYDYANNISLSNLAAYFIQIEEYNLAHGYASQAYFNDKYHIQAVFNKALSLRGLKRYEEAYKFFKICESLNKDNEIDVIELNDLINEVKKYV